MYIKNLTVKEVRNTPYRLLPDTNSTIPQLRSSSETSTSRRGNLSKNSSKWKTQLPKKYNKKTLKLAHTKKFNKKEISISITRVKMEIAPRLLSLLNFPFRLYQGLPLISSLSHKKDNDMNDLILTILLKQIRGNDRKLTLKPENKRKTKFCIWFWFTNNNSVTKRLSFQKE